MLQLGDVRTALTGFFQAVDAVLEYFQNNKDAEAYITILDVSGNAKVLQSVVQQGRKLGKTIYVVSPDRANARIAHINFVSETAKAKGLDANQWGATVTGLIGGKACSYSPVDLYGFADKSTGWRQRG